MSAGPTPIYADWYLRGSSDLEDAELLLLQGGHLENAAFFIQQAVEKHLKGFIIGMGGPLERTHDLETLLTAASAYDATLRPFASFCQMATEYYFETRYPDVAATVLTASEVKQSLNEAKKLVGHIETLLPPPPPSPSVSAPATT